MMYSLWSETNCNETKWFWIVDEVHNGKEEVVDSGIEDTKEQALVQIKQYIPDAT